MITSSGNRDFQDEWNPDDSARLQFCARYRATPYEASCARQAVATFLRAAGFVSGDIFDVETAVGEAVANAIEHGNKHQGHFYLAVRVDEATVTIDVQDSGSGFFDIAREPVEGRGFGIDLMRALVDTVSFHEGGRCVRLQKRLAAPMLIAGFEEQEA